MTDPEASQKRKFYRSDPIADFIFQKLRLSPVSFGLLSVLLAIGIYLFVAWVSDTLWTKPGQTGLLQDPIPWVLIFLICPVVYGYYLWSFEAIDHVIRNLEASDVLETDSDEIDKISYQAYSQKWRKLITISSSVIFSIFVFSTRQGLKNSWTSSASLPIATVTIATLVTVYMGTTVVLNFITNIWILHQILGKKGVKLNINPLHPDRCGGLQALSDYALKTAYLVAVLGILIGAMEYQYITQGVGTEYWFVHLTIPMYILLSIACFFGPLLAAHRGMQTAKRELLHQIARQFQTDYELIHNSLQGDAKALKEGSEKIKEIRAFYSLTDEFPVWPFDVQTFRRFLLTVPAPLLPILAGALQKLFSMLLKKWGIG